MNKTPNPWFESRNTHTHLMMLSLKKLEIFINLINDINILKVVYLLYHEQAGTSILFKKFKLSLKHD